MGCLLPPHDCLLLGRASSWRERGCGPPHRTSGASPPTSPKASARRAASRSSSLSLSPSLPLSPPALLLDSVTTRSAPQQRDTLHLRATSLSTRLQVSCHVLSAPAQTKEFAYFLPGRKFATLAQATGS